MSGSSFVVPSAVFSGGGRSVWPRGCCGVAFFAVCGAAFGCLVWPVGWGVLVRFGRVGRWWSGVLVVAGWVWRVGRQVSHVWHNYAYICRLVDDSCLIIIAYISVDTTAGTRYALASHDPEIRPPLIPET